MDDFRMRTTTSLPVTVRLTRATDLLELEWHGLYTPMREVIQAAFRAQTRGDLAMLVADINGFPAAQAWVDFVRKGRMGLATVWAVRVFPPFQRCGLGSLLMQAVEQEVLAHGMDTAELGVDRDNAEVLSFYKRLGYTAMGAEQGRFVYRTPEGVRMDVAVDQWLLRKHLVTERKRLMVGR